MKLNQKIMIIFAITLVCLIFVWYAASKAVLLRSFAEEERYEARKDIELARAALVEEQASLNVVAGNWAAWDDTYDFIVNGDENFIKANLPDGTFNHLQINLVMLVDYAGEVVYSRCFDLVNQVEIPLPARFLDELAPGGQLLSFPHINSGVNGIITLPEGPMLVATHPILTSEQGGPIRGTLIMGRYLDEERIRRLSQMTELSIALRPWGDAGNEPDFQEAGSLLSEDNPLTVQVLNDDFIAGYTRLNDIHGQPALIMRVDINRAVHQLGEMNTRYLLLALVAVSLLFCFLTLLLLKRTVLSRLSHLNECVGLIGRSGDLSLRAPVEGFDELSDLATVFNETLDKLEDAQREIREREMFYRAVVDDQTEFICRYLPDGTRTFVNEAYARHYNCRPEELLGVSFFSTLPQDELERMREYLASFSQARPVAEMEHKVVFPSGEVHWHRWTDRAMFDSQGRVVEFQSVGRDVTEQKRMEEQLRYFSLHDPLTGLYNRAYFEEEMRRCAGGRYRPIGLIVCDVDGLKLVNDTLGHDAGDSLLIAAAQVIRKCFREGDAVARIGGDEFAVLMPNSTCSVVDNACRRIREEIGKYNRANPELPLSISIGYSHHSSPVNMSDLFKEADNNMYREKLHSGQSARSAIVETLMKALGERDFITGGHVERLHSLVGVMAARIELPEHRLNELYLLAKFHDIGKVGIPDRILFKQGPLTPEEFTEMKRHCEIGRRIALSAHDLTPIADWILKHHEWWNGGGYPLGLQGEEIPLECRILAMADAYDAMTSDRPYRRAMSHREAAEELRRCAGIQFDPHLVEVFISVLEKLDRC